MFEKLQALYNLFRVGECVADPAKYKTYQVTANMLGAAILGVVRLAKAFNYDLPIDEATADTIGGGIIAAINVVLTITTTKTIGVMAEKPFVDNEHLNLPRINFPNN